MKKTYYGDREKCYVCYRPKSSCMCEYFEKIETHTKFVILMHPKEFKKVKNNTGFFTHRSLPNSELFIGVDFTDNSRINEIISTHKSYILFPSPDAHNLTEKPLVKAEKPLAVFLIDSTWACTKSIFFNSKNLQQLPHLSFTTPQRSVYDIKEQPSKEYLSTIESTQVVLDLLNNYQLESIDAKKLQNFLQPFIKMIQYQKKLITNPKSNAVRFKKRKS